MHDVDGVLRILVQRLVFSIQHAEAAQVTRRKNTPRGIVETAMQKSTGSGQGAAAQGAGTPATAVLARSGPPR